MAWYKPAHLFRTLRPNEAALAREVFHNTLPPLHTIGITDGLGKDNQIWTIDRWFHDFIQSEPPKSLNQLKYLLNFGQAVHWDLSSPQTLTPAVPGYPDRARDILVHELTHVWQFNRGMGVKLGSLIGARGHYEYEVGEPWVNYNVEQQASVVEHWNRDRKANSGVDDQFFPYIHYIIRQEGQWKPSFNNVPGPDGAKIDQLWTMNLDQLAALLAGERGFDSKDTADDPIRVTVQDNSQLVVLDGDVLFDFGKAFLKPQANPVLQRAAATIQANSGPNLRAVLINGHTDGTGDAVYNVGLSERRAKTVADWFVSRGYLLPSIIRTQGFGKTQPLAPNTDAANRARNRRVEIYLMNR
jgi:outer membrane protein OmpA-like peptidoglycan-associated protein